VLRLALASSRRANRLSVGFIVDVCPSVVCLSSVIPDNLWDISVVGLPVTFVVVIKDSLYFGNLEANCSDSLTKTICHSVFHRCWMLFIVLEVDTEKAILVVRARNESVKIHPEFIIHRHADRLRAGRANFTRRSLHLRLTQLINPGL